MPLSPESKRVFRFLQRLRVEGRTNMYGAVPYLMRSFALDRDLAFSIVCDWVDQQAQATAPFDPKPPRRKPGGTMPP
jgi:hypothetical protein